MTGLDRSTTEEDPESMPGISPASEEEEDGPGSMPVISAASEEEDPAPMPGISTTSEEEDPGSMLGICKEVTTEEVGEEDPGPIPGICNHSMIAKGASKKTIERDRKKCGGVDC
jgi:hypothetical protein